jgi:oligopeptide transport system permease protein
VDSIAIVFIVIGLSVPSFVIATLVQYIFGIKLGLLPIARWGTAAQAILPMISLAAMPAAFIAKMTRARMVQEMGQGYATAARAKGLSNSAIVFKHLLRNAIPPVLAYAAPLAAAIMTGSFVIEKIFNIPGLGYWFVASVSNRDYPLIMGVTVFYCALILAASVMVDILLIVLDPRLRASVLQPQRTP